MALKIFTPNSSAQKISESLKSEGAVIVSDIISNDLADAVSAQLRIGFDRQGGQFQNEFNGFKTLRLANVLEISPASAELIAHDQIVEIIDYVLLPFCINYRIGSTTGIEIRPGEGEQMLHTDGGIYPLSFPGMELQVSVMWALDAFTEENGATRVIPRSHLKMNPDPVELSGVEHALMQKGSALLYLGSVVHGGGKNQSQNPRMGLVNTYALGWLRQEVNQYLTITEENIMKLPEKVQRLMGYQGHGPYLGRYEGDPDGYWYHKHKN